MNLLSYSSICHQSLYRLDMVDDMLKWSQAMSETSLKKRNFRQLKKFLQNKGWVYTRKHPLKGKGRTTVSLLSIVRQNSVDEFNKNHSSDIPDIDVHYHSIQPLNLHADLGADGLPVLKDQNNNEIGLVGVQNEAGEVEYRILPKPIKAMSREEALELNDKIFKESLKKIESGDLSNVIDIMSVVNKAKPFNDRKEIYGDKAVFGGKLVSLARELTSQENPINTEFLLGPRRGFARVTTEEIVKSLIEERAGVKLRFSSDCEALSPKVHSTMLAIVQMWSENSDEVQSLLNRLDKEFGLKLDLEKK